MREVNLPTFVDTRMVSEGRVVVGLAMGNLGCSLDPYFMLILRTQFSSHSLNGKWNSVHLEIICFFIIFLPHKAPFSYFFRVTPFSFFFPESLFIPLPGIPFRTFAGWSFFVFFSGFLFCTFYGYPLFCTFPRYPFFRTFPRYPHFRTFPGYPFFVLFSGIPFRIFLGSPIIKAFTGKGEVLFSLFATCHQSYLIMLDLLH